MKTTAPWQNITRTSLRPAITAALLASSGTLMAGVTFVDNFTTAGSPGAVWVTDTDTNNTANATVNVGGGVLNVNSGVVTGLDPVRHTLHLVGTGAPSLTLASDWTIEADIHLASSVAFTTLAGGEGVGISLDVRNNLPGKDDRAQINIVGLNFGSGMDFATRGVGRIAGTEQENIENLGAATADLNATIRMAYDATAGTISFGADVGSGFFELVDPVAASSWDMTTSDPLQIGLEMGMVKFGSGGAASTFSIGDGEVTLDNFTIHDVALDTGNPLVMVPEPSSLALLALGTSGFIARRRRKTV